MYPVKTGISYFGNRNPHHFEKDLAEIKAHGCNFIVHTYSENDQQFYRKTLAQMVEMTRQAGLECYLDPWGVGRVFGGETYSAFALRNLHTLQRLPDDSYAPAACFNHPEFRAFMQRWIADAAEIGADVLFWDEPHFFIDLKQRAKHDIWYCRCAPCCEKFRTAMGHDFAQASRDAIVRFRENCVVEFLTELCDSTAAAGMRNAVCLLPFKDSSIGLSDWSRVAAIGNIDIFGTDPYWMFFEKDVDEFVGAFADEVADLCRRFGKEPQLWIQGYNIISGREDELRRAIDIASDAGIRNIAAWSFQGNAYMSYNRSENPERVWQVLGEAYRKLTNQ